MTRHPVLLLASFALPLVASITANAQSAANPESLYVGRQAGDHRIAVILSQPGVGYSITDHHDEDPFGRSKKYSSTSTSCQVSIYFMNASDRPVAVENSFATILGLKIERSSRDPLVIQGNLGLSAGANMMDTGNVIGPHEGFLVDAVSMESQYHESPEAAQQAMIEGGCLISDAIAVLPAGIIGTVMWDDMPGWVQLGDYIDIRLE